MRLLIDINTDCPDAPGKVFKLLEKNFDDLIECVLLDESNEGQFYMDLTDGEITKNIFTKVHESIVRNIHENDDDDGPEHICKEKDVFADLEVEEPAQKKYLHHGGHICPHCSSKEIEAYGSLNSDDAIAWQQVSCNTCEATWTDQYKLTAFDTLEVPK